MLGALKRTALHVHLEEITLHLSSAQIWGSMMATDDSIMPNYDNFVFHPGPNVFPKRRLSHWVAPHRRSYKSPIIKIKFTPQSKELSCIGAKSWFFQKFRPRKPCAHECGRLFLFFQFLGTFFNLGFLRFFCLKIVENEKSRARPRPHTVCEAQISGKIMILHLCSLTLLI